MTQSELLGKAACALKRLHRHVFGISLVVLLFALDSWSFAAEPPGYYATAEGKIGPALRDALHQIIAGHSVVTYSSSTRSDTVDALKFLDEDTSDTNNVFVLYAQKSEPKNSYGQTGGWQHEHRWPNSYGIDSIGPAYSDLYNLHAEDANVNASRGNKYYDDSDPTDRNYHNPAHAEASLCTSDTDSWEPPASIKGDLARSMFYMAIRYTGDGLTDSGVATVNLMVVAALVVAAPPVIQSIAASGDNVIITWTAIAGKVYQVEYKSDLAASTWRVLSGDVTASTDSAAKADVTASTARRFYRIVAMP